MKQQTIKLIGLFFAVLIISDLILFIAGKVSNLIFWIIIIISAIMAYKVIPSLKSK